MDFFCLKITILKATVICAYEAIQSILEEQQLNGSLFTIAQTHKNNNLRILLD